MSTKKTSGPSSDPVLAAIEGLARRTGAGFAAVREDVADLRGTLTTHGRDLASYRTEARADVALLRTEIGGDIAAVRTDLELTTKKMDAGFAEIHVQNARTNESMGAGFAAVVEELRLIRTSLDASNAMLREYAERTEKLEGAEVPSKRAGAAKR